MLDYVLAKKIRFTLFKHNSNSCKRKTFFNIVLKILVYEALRSFAKHAQKTVSSCPYRVISNAEKENICYSKLNEREWERWRSRLQGWCNWQTDSGMREKCWTSAFLVGGRKTQKLKELIFELDHRPNLWKNHQKFPRLYFSNCYCFQTVDCLTK